MHKIMEAKDPAIQKRVRVEGFRDREWRQIAPEVMYKGVKAKFSSNEGLKQQLLATGTKYLVEASHKDSYWGIGIGLHDQKINHKTKWGENQLGKILMRVRDELR